MKTLKQKIKQMVAGTAVLAMLYSPALATTKKQEAPKQQKKGTFCISPAYSIPKEYGTVRFSGAGKAYGIGIGGFLDLFGTKERPADMKTHFGKITASKSLDSVVKGSGMAVELTTKSAGKDEIRAGIFKTGKLGKGGYKVIFYPIAPKGKGPHAGLFLSQKLTDKADISAFLTSDIGAGTYYGEAKFTYCLAKDFSFLLQERYGGKFGKDFKPQTHIGVEVKF